MIKVSRFNKSEFWLNPHQLEFMEATPDTVLTMLSGKTLVVRESVDEIQARIVDYRTRLFPGERPEGIRAGTAQEQ